MILFSNTSVTTPEVGKILSHNLEKLCSNLNSLFSEAQDFGQINHIIIAPIALPPEFKDIGESISRRNHGKSAFISKRVNFNVIQSNNSQKIAEEICDSFLQGVIEFENKYKIYFDKLKYEIIQFRAFRGQNS